MAKEKKRLSKNAKATLKILNDSKLLANAKSSDESAAAQNYKNGKFFGQTEHHPN